MSRNIVYPKHPFRLTNRSIWNLYGLRQWYCHALCKMLKKQQQKKTIGQLCNKLRAKQGDREIWVHYEFLVDTLYCNPEMPRRKDRAISGHKISGFSCVPSLTRLSSIAECLNATQNPGCQCYLTEGVLCENSLDANCTTQLFFFTGVAVIVWHEMVTILKTTFLNTFLFKQNILADWYFSYRQTSNISRVITGVGNDKFLVRTKPSLNCCHWGPRNKCWWNRDKMQIFSFDNGLTVTS